MGVRVVLYHPILDRTIEVNASRVPSLIRSGWRQFHSETRAVVAPDPSLVIGDPFLTPSAQQAVAQIPAEEADQPTPSKED